MTLSSLTLWFRYFILSLSLLQWSSLTSPLQWSQPCLPRPDLTPHPTIRPHPSMTDMLLLLTQSTQVSKRKETWYILQSFYFTFISLWLISVNSRQNDWFKKWYSLLSAVKFLIYLSYYCTVVSIMLQVISVALCIIQHYMCTSKFK